MLKALRRIENGLVSNVINLHKNNRAYNKDNQFCNFFNSKIDNIDNILINSSFSENKIKEEYNNNISYTDMKIDKFYVEDSRMECILISSNNLDVISIIKDL